MKKFDFEPATLATATLRRVREKLYPELPYAEGEVMCYVKPIEGGQVQVIISREPLGPKPDDKKWMVTVKTRMIETGFRTPTSEEVDGLDDILPVPMNQLTMMEPFAWVEI